MARRRFFRPHEKWDRGPRINEQIRKNPVRLIDENDQMIGVVDVRDALDRARAADLDLVEVAADSDPPVCRILDYGKYKYEQSKKDKANKAKSKTAEMKEVRLGRSMKIDPHDIQIRLNQARRFLMEGHKVQIVQNFRGREMVHRHRGTERLQQIVDELSDISKLEAPPRQAGRRMSMILAPDKAKIQQVKRRQQHEQQKSSPGQELAATAETEAPEAMEERGDELSREDSQPREPRPEAMEDSLSHEEQPEPARARNH